MGQKLSYPVKVTPQGDLLILSKCNSKTEISQPVMALYFSVAGAV